MLISSLSVAKPCSDKLTLKIFCNNVYLSQICKFWSHLAQGFLNGVGVPGFDINARNGKAVVASLSNGLPFS